MFQVLIFLAAIAAANLSVYYFGPLVTPINAFFLIGLDLSLRDSLHEQWAGRFLWPKMFALIATGGAIAFAINPAAINICIASSVSFLCAGIADAFVYQLFIQRPWLQKVNFSNAAGAVVDSALFPTIAFGRFLPLVILLQLAAKLAGGFIWSLILNRRKGNE